MSEKEFKNNKNVEKIKNAQAKAKDFFKSLSPYMIGGVLVGLGFGFMMHNVIAGLLVGIGVGYILEQIFLDHDPSE